MLGLCGAIAIGLLIVTTRSTSPWVPVGVVVSLLLFVGPMLFGARLLVASNRRATTAVISQTSAATGGKLVSALELRVGEESLSVEGTVLALSPLDETPIGEAAARRRFGLPTSLNSPDKLTVVRTGLQSGVTCLVAGPMSSRAEPDGSYRGQRHRRVFSGTAGQPVVLC